MGILAVVTSAARILRWNSLAVDQDLQTIAVAGTIIATTPAEFRLFEFLVSNRDIPLSKEAILETLFGPGHGRNLRQVDIFVARLRQSFNAAGVGDVISTVAGRGYAVLDGVGEIDVVGALGPRADEMLLAA